MHMQLEKLLQLMSTKTGSDLFITTGVPISMKVHGKIIPVTKHPLSSQQTYSIVTTMMDAKQKAEFDKKSELQFAIASPMAGRFRVSAFRQRNNAGAVLRRIETKIPSVKQLGLPETIHELAMTKRGLVLFVGATGTGKSTSLAAIIGHRNKHSSGHIISIEDPIEYMHKHHKCIVTQREVGVDTESFEVALRNTLRQAPDVILIGEIRTQDVMEYALTFSETGHLCLSTLHANNANQALDRIINFFPPEKHKQTLMDLSLNLKAIVAQQLLPTPDGRSRRLAVEILINSPLVADMIRKGNVHDLKALMVQSTELGMQTFDQALFKLYTAGEITYENALSHADSANDLRLMIKLSPDTSIEESKNASGDLSLENAKPS